MQSLHQSLSAYDLSAMSPSERRKLRRVTANLDSLLAWLDQQKPKGKIETMNFILDFARQVEAAGFMRKGSTDRRVRRLSTPIRSARLATDIARFRSVFIYCRLGEVSLAAAQELVALDERVGIETIKASCRRVKRNGPILIMSKDGHVSDYTDLQDMIAMMPNAPGAPKRTAW